MFKPLNNRVLVKPDEAEEKTSFGLLLPDSQKDKPVTGEVIVGNDDVAQGDKVLFSRYGYDEVTINNEVLYVVSASSVLGIF